MIRRALSVLFPAGLVWPVPPVCLRQGTPARRALSVLVRSLLSARPAPRWPSWAWQDTEPPR